jgi:hypothetical protein
MSIIVPANDAAGILPSAAAVGNWQLYMLGTRSKLDISAFHSEHDMSQTF